VIGLRGAEGEYAEGARDESARIRKPRGDVCEEKWVNPWRGKGLSVWDDGGEECLKRMTPSLRSSTAIRGKSEPFLVRKGCRTLIF
jgi:hypothetical protein